MDPLHDADNHGRQHRHRLANVLDSIVRIGAVGIGTAQAMNISSSSGLSLPMVMMGGYIVAGVVVEGLQTVEPFVRNKLLRFKRRCENEEPMVLRRGEEEGEERPARRARFSPSEAEEEQASVSNSDTENEQDEESSVEEPHQEPSRSRRSFQSRSHASFSVLSLSSSSEDDDEEDDKNNEEWKETQLETEDVAVTTQEDERSDLDTVVSNGSNDDDRSGSPELLAPIPPTPTQDTPLVNRISFYGAADVSPMNPCFAATPSSASSIRIAHAGDSNADLNKLRSEVKRLRLEGNKFVRHMNAETCPGIECPFELTPSECSSVRNHINHLCHCDGGGGIRCSGCAEADKYLWTHVRHCCRSDCQVTLCGVRKLNRSSSQSQ